MTGQEPVREIEQLYLDLIARAERWIYAESQYFASRKIAEAIAKRLEEPDGPEIVIINPVQADGWLEQEAMDSARAQLLDALEKRDPHGRLGVFLACGLRRWDPRQHGQFRQHGQGRPSVTGFEQVSSESVEIFGVREDITNQGDR